MYLSTAICCELRECTEITCSFQALTPWCLSPSPSLMVFVVAACTWLLYPLACTAALGSSAAPISKQSPLTCHIYGVRCPTWLGPASLLSSCMGRTRLQLPVRRREWEYNEDGRLHQFVQACIATPRAVGRKGQASLHERSVRGFERRSTTHSLDQI